MKHKTYLFGFLAVTLISATLFKLGITNSVGCNAFGGGTGKFMAYCNVKSYGHYDHAAYLFNTEEGLDNRVRQANLLFLGSSRSQFTFSTNSLTDFVVNHPKVRPYLLGFGHTEQDVFSAAVLDRIKPIPALIVINADPFFSQSASPHATQLLSSSGLEEVNARIKKLWYGISETACDDKLPVVGHLICGSNYTIYRSVQDGRWIDRKKNLASIAVSELLQTHSDDEAIIAYAANAQTFLSRLHVDRRCTVLTYIPTVNGKPFIAKGIAARLGTPFIAPQLTSLSTFDGSHLDTASSEHWSKAFLTELEPILAACLR
jgi:hypothetical protein